METLLALFIYGLVIALVVIASRAVRRVEAETPLREAFLRIAGMPAGESRPERRRPGAPTHNW